MTTGHCTLLSVFAYHYIKSVLAYQHTMYQRLSHTFVTPPPSEKQTEKCILNVFSLSNVQHLDFINTKFFSHKQNLKAIIFILSSSNHELSDR